MIISGHKNRLKNNRDSVIARKNEIRSVPMTRRVALTIRSIELRFAEGTINHAGVLKTCSNPKNLPCLQEHSFLSTPSPINSVLEMLFYSPKKDVGSPCRSYCYTDCFPCNTRANCDMLVDFGILVLCMICSCLDIWIVTLLVYMRLI